MPNLPRYSLVSDEAKGDWRLRNDQTGKTTRRYATKREATRGGVLEDAVGGGGGSIRIHKQSGEFQEERTFPGSRDPKKSPG